MGLELHQEEHVIYAGHPSWRGTLSFYVRGGLFALVAAAIVAAVTAIGSGFDVALTIVAFVVVMAVVILIGFLFRFSTTYTITNQRLTIERGILSKHMQQTRVERVQNVNTDQSLLDRLLRVGQVDFDTAGADDSDFTFRGIANPEQVVRAVDKAHREREAGLTSQHPDQLSPGGL
ncbi:PH domain-containing protein [Conexibacter sp. CPCC 206217]|uniref:PH domain-containing protein n=1 Tax=Conexibacter sp. CPCC 206217 TaxID=3064574 RepID=UPI00271FBEB3|nr:PH domain-containing protein [Conexibacter sp. CPCC 206217]MDO8212745.1 PH domain-containing protein [Conexibacter sp. CPCC 206217]